MLRVIVTPMRWRAVMPNVDTPAGALLQRFESRRRTLCVLTVTVGGRHRNCRKTNYQFKR